MDKIDRSVGVGRVSSLDGILAVLSDGMLYGTHGSRRIAERVLYNAAIEILVLRRERELLRRMLGQMAPDVDLETTSLEEVVALSMDRFARLVERSGAPWGG